MISLLHQLPSPPLDRSGWPWTEASSTLPLSFPDGRPWPKISIVTPSYNQGHFLEETIRSVLLQGYPNLEYIIIDGGSTDASVQIIKKYEKWLTYWVSEKDKGQSHAINKGWSKATGDIIAYLNSDDIYLPNSLGYVAEAWITQSRPAAVVGSVVMTDSLSRAVAESYRPMLPHPGPLDLTVILPDLWCLPQQSSFWSKWVLDKVGRSLREDLQYTMDRELYYRVCRVGRLSFIDKELATYRFHSDSKTVSCIMPMFYEDSKVIDLYISGDNQDKIRKTVARHRHAQGHFRYASLTDNRLSILINLIYAIVLRTQYITNIKTYKHAARSIGLLAMYKTMKKLFVKTHINK